MEIGNEAAGAAALWTALNLAVMLGLSALVVRQRRRHKIALGDGGVPELARAVRALGNAAEYIPAVVAALAVLVLAGAPQQVVHLAGGLLFLGRASHAVGMSITAGPSIGRFVGMLATWVAWLFVIVCLLFYAL